MHDPLTQIFYTKYFSLWHKDPETDGTDDSCGWFQRTRHFDKTQFEKVVREFEFNFEHNYWFTEGGSCIFSTMGIVLEMYKAASWTIHYPDYKTHKKYLREHIVDILSFAENPFDSLHRSITSEMYYRPVEHDRSMVGSRKDRIRHLASCVYDDIMRSKRPWYKHPRWHVHHWKLSIHWRVIFPFLCKREKAYSNVDQNLRDTV
jgi:hypothetical protein